MTINKRDKYYLFGIFRAVIAYFLWEHGGQGVVVAIIVWELMVIAGKVNAYED